jgi:PKD repeat protein
MIFTMMRKLVFILLLFTFACSSRSGNQQDPVDSSTGEVKLILNASPRQGFAPMHVTLQGNLGGAGVNDQKYYCLQEEWDFGDGAKSTEKPHCDPWGPDAKVKTEYFVDHEYDQAGNYTIRLVLGEEGSTQVHSRQVSIVVLERELQPN